MNEGGRRGKIFFLFKQLKHSFGEDHVQSSGPVPRKAHEPSGIIVFTTQTILALLVEAAKFSYYSITIHFLSIFNVSFYFMVPI